MSGLLGVAGVGLPSGLIGELDCRRGWAVNSTAVGVGRVDPPAVVLCLI